MTILIEYTKIKGVIKTKAHGLGAALFMRMGDQAWIHEEAFDADCMVKVEGSTDSVAPIEADGEMVAEAEVADGDVGGDDEDSDVVEDAEEETVEGDDSEEVEPSDEEIKAMNRGELHAYARSKGVSPFGKKMEKILEELGVE